jgi:hypothetical protein
LTGLNALPILRQFAGAGWRIRLLLKAPASFGLPAGTSEAGTTIRRIQSESALAKQVTIRVYDGFPAMHGVLMPNAAAIGWFSYIGQDRASVDIVGYHRQPMILARTDKAGGAALHRMLHTEIEELWPNAQAPT